VLGLALLANAKESKQAFAEIWSFGFYLKEVLLPYRLLVQFLQRTLEFMFTKVAL
jgi:hypothetical protein